MKLYLSRITQRASRKGIALIIVMISILVLSVLAGGFAIFTKTETTLARNSNNEAELEWLGRSGVEYCRWILAQQMSCPAEPFDSLCQTWAGGPGGACSTNGPLADVQKEVQLGHGSFTWKMTDLESKWNINIAQEPILNQAMSLMQVDPSESVPVVSAILDWVDPDDREHVEGAENDYYHGLNPPYDCKNGPIDDISELLMIRGISQEMYWGPNATNHPASAWQQKLNRYGPSAAPPSYTAGLVDLFTPFGTGKLNINTASATALQVIPMIDQARAEAIVAARSCDEDGATVAGATGPFRSVDAGYLFNRVPNLGLEAARMIQQYCDIRSRTFEVHIEARINNYKREFVAILGRNTPRDIQILTFYWK
jgi:type II secretory pathway component PulK